VGQQDVSAAGRSRAGARQLPGAAAGPAGGAP